MKIDSSYVTMQGRHREVQVDQRRESVRAWVGEPPPVAGGGPEDKVTFEPPGRALGRATAPGQCRRCGEDPGPKLPGHVRVRLAVLVALLERMTGRRVEIFDPGDVAPAEGEQPPPGAPVEATAEGPASVGWGLEIRAEQTHYQSERTSFEASGVVHTADGREITFDVSVGMSRELMSHESIEIRAGDALIDPLVINLDDAPAELTDTTFAFDLDLDGAEDSMRSLAAGSGYLALDRDGNGQVDDGSELFGPTTGSGFAELAAFDHDANGWIDEADDVFHRLQVWTRDDDGDHLLALADVGVGAIFLGHVATPFTLTDDAGVQRGQVAASGVYLNEDGSAGTIQELDLVV